MAIDDENDESDGRALWALDFLNEEEEKEEAAARERLRSPSSGSPGLSTRVSPPCGVSFDGGAPVDLLVRTSGETRLSDFILWGVSGHAVLCFLEVLWPDFSFTDMCHAAWTYQVSARHARAGRRRFKKTRNAASFVEASLDRQSGVREGSRAETLNRRERREEERKQTKKAATAADAAARSDARNARDDSRGNVSVAWVDVGKEKGGGDSGAGAAYAFVAERNRKIVEETARIAGVAAT